MLLVAFNRVGGLDALFGLCREFVNVIDMISQVNADDRSEVTKQELSHAFSGLKVALGLLQPIVSSRPLFDSTQTPLAITTDKKDTEADYFEPHNFLVRMRHAVLPLIRSIWEAGWLASAPIGVSKLTVHIVMELLNAENEEVKDVQTSASILGPGGIGIPRMPPIAGPDENRIRQLMDMGFPRSAAERALVRTRNNVNAATELLLAQPYPFPPDPDPPAAEAQPAAADGEAPAPAEEQAEGDATQPASEGTSSNSENEAAAEPNTEESSPTPPGKTAEEWVKELNVARDPLKEDIGRRVLALVDEHPSLVFDVQKVFVGPTGDYRTQAVKSLIDDIQTFSPSAYDVQEQPLSVRCHLLALVLGEPSSPAAQMPDKEAENLMNVLLSLLLSNPGENEHPTIPKWLSAQLLVVESLLVMGDSPRSITLPKENEPIVREAIAQGPRYADARNTLFDFCMRLLAVPTLPKDELISVLRLIVLLTRDPAIADSFVKRNGVGSLFQYLRVSSGTQSGSGIQSYIAIIVRHVVENQSTLQSVMRQEVKRFFAHPRTRMVDIGTFVSGCNSTALRDPEAFVKVTEELCQLSQPYGSMKTISLRPDTSTAAPAASTDSKDKSNEMQVDEPPVAAPSGAPAESTEALIHYLLGELIRTVKTDIFPESASNTSTTEAAKSPDLPPSTSEPTAETTQPTSDPKPPQDPVDYTYPCFIMQVLTELLFSYESCKIAFLSYTPKKRNQTPAKDSGLKHRTAAIQFLLSDLMTFGTINPQPPSTARKQITLCNWAMSVIVALCVDTSSSQDIKDVPTDLISVRKFVLEAISRALKDLPSADNPETRYSRLLALADLCHRLLTVRFNVNGKKASDDVPTHVAKVMLEKNFVATLTNVLSEVDLNYPNIRNVVSSVLRPLEHLYVTHRDSSCALALISLAHSTKIAMKMSRVSDKNKELLEEKAGTSESAMSEDDDDEEDETENPENEEASHVYRNSSLGLYVHA